MEHPLPQAVRLLLGIVVPLAAFATGLRASAGERWWLYQRRGLLGRSLLAVLIAVPVATLVILALFRPAALTRTGLLITILAVGIGPPAAFQRTAGANARVGYEIGLNAVLLALSLVFVPAALALCRALLDQPITLDPAQVAGVVLGRALLPLSAGMLVAQILPRVTERLTPYADAIVHAALPALVIAVLAVGGRHLREVDGLTWLLCAAVAMAALAIGHALGGPDRETRGVLAAFSAMRFPALALLIASATPDEARLIPTVLAYVVTSAVVIGAYGALRVARAQHRSVPPPVETAPRPA